MAWEQGSLGKEVGGKWIVGLKGAGGLEAGHAVVVAAATGLVAWGIEGWNQEGQFGQFGC